MQSWHPPPSLHPTFFKGLFYFPSTEREGREKHLCEREIPLAASCTHPNWMEPTPWDVH